MEETLPRMRVPNPHLEPRFPRRRTQIAMGEVLEPRALRGGVCKEGNCLGERGTRAILETVVTGLTGIYRQTVKTCPQKVFFFMKDLRIYGRKDVPF
jgi:hypothetical protein